MCGIVGIVSTEPVNQQVYDSLLLLQHRGQDSTGIATADGDQFHWVVVLDLPLHLTLFTHHARADTPRNHNIRAAVWIWTNR